MKNADLIRKLAELINALATAILMTEAKAGKIDAAVLVVNEAFELNGEPKPLPTGEYKRRTWLMDDLVRMRLQLIEELRELYTVDEARKEAELANLGIDGLRRVALYRDTVVNVEEAHAAALEEDRERAIDAYTEAPAEIRIEQETSDKEFKRGITHCFTDCGFNCRESVRVGLIEHYTKIAVENGLVAEGWHLHVWHNTGWHVVFKHDASGLMLSDGSVEGGIREIGRNLRHNPARRWSCYNYDYPEGCKQVWVYAATSWQAIGAAIREMQKRIAGYRGVIGALAPKQCDHARAADLYGETPANGYEVKA